MRFFRRQKDADVKGEIGYFGLTEWWVSTFTEAEREYIDAKYQPMGAPPHTLTRGTIQYSTASSAQLLWGLATWFRKPEDFSIASRILEKAEMESLARDGVIGLHFTYLGMIETNYRMRDKVPGALDKAIEYCYKQITLAPKAAKAFKQQSPKMPLPRHTGFEQLAIVREKQGDYAEAIQLSQQAQKQGWAGDWDKRILRCKKKLEKGR